MQARQYFISLSKWIFKIEEWKNHMEWGI